MPPASPSSRHVTRRPASAVVALLAAAATCLAGAVVVPSAAQAARSSAETESGAAARSAVTAIQANIKSDLSTERFRADVSEVLAMQPDIVTYNEVPLRYDTVLAPDGYDVHRKMKNRYTKATAVAWRSDRWTAIDSGTIRVSNYREIPQGRNIRLGLRFANWVTLQGTDGRVLSVVAAHVAPLDDDMPDLLRPSVRKIGALVTELAPSGPVIVGGDFNVHYRSGRYPRDLFDDARMVPTYDTLGNHFATGDHHGATIDYLFNRGADVLGATQHRAVELNSDHDAVVAGYDWLVDSPEETQRLASDPTGDATDKRRAVSALSQAIAATEPGETLDVVGTGLAIRTVFRKLRAAMKRGVAVRYLTRSPDLTRRERGLERVAADVAGGSSVAQCAGDCLRAWRQSDMARTFLLRSDAGSAVQRIDVNRVLTTVMLQQRTRMVVRTGEIGLREGEQMLAQLR
jgi:endonuclease/exonuclease/phosphatase (EEP) superfamily protein YafD